ncbi:hypothetical protein CLIM01_07848 [Colletotrichum limetticola]|uniref:Uncharacterized protein n=1 Tax=Colletotrichum limetticola TaxID=1209924 RepID=A0ABQ9PTF3_9PEZI|nr:hypothetical protein CLIM01_07848 [Colletotrichum limetticola]
MFARPIACSTTRAAALVRRCSAYHVGHSCHLKNTYCAIIRPRYQACIEHCPAAVQRTPPPAAGHLPPTFASCPPRDLCCGISVPSATVNPRREAVCNMSPVTATDHAMPSTSSASLVSPQQKSDKSLRTPTGQSTQRQRQRQRQRHKQAPGRGKQSESNKTTQEKKEVTSASGRLDELACIAFGPVVLHAPVHQQREAHSRLPHGLPAARDTAVQRSAPLLTRRPICIVHESGHAMPTHHRAPIGHPLTNPASFNQHQPTPSATPHPSPISINNSRSRGPIVDYQTESFLPLSCSSF